MADDPDKRPAGSEPKPLLLRYGNEWPRTGSVATDFAPGVACCAAMAASALQLRNIRTKQAAAYGVVTCLFQRLSAVTVAIRYI